MTVIIIDNGSQYTHLIKRNCRDLDFYAEVLNNKTATFADVEAVRKKDKITHVILSGGPSSVYAGNNGVAEEIVRRVSTGGLKSAGAFDVSLLGICFGHQLIAHALGGKVEQGKSAEYGIAKITIDDSDEIFAGVPHEINAWVSHFDEVKKMPEGFVSLAHSATCAHEGMRHKTKKIFGVQFHPEVWHTEHGEDILGKFLGL